MTFKFKDTSFQIPIDWYCDQVDLKTMSDEEIFKIAETTSENVKNCMPGMLQMIRKQLNEED